MKKEGNREGIPSKTASNTPTFEEFEGKREGTPSNSAAILLNFRKFTVRTCGDALKSGAITMQNKGLPRRTARKQIFSQDRRYIRPSSANCSLKASLASSIVSNEPSLYAPITEINARSYASSSATKCEASALRALFRRIEYGF